MKRELVCLAASCLLACTAGEPRAPGAPGPSSLDAATTSQGLDGSTQASVPAADARAWPEVTTTDSLVTYDGDRTDSETRADLGLPADAAAPATGPIVVTPPGATAPIGNCPMAAGTTGAALSGPAGPWNVGRLGRVAATSSASTTADGVRLVGGLSGGRNFDGKYENRPDEAFYVHKRVEGDVTITAKVTALSGLSGFGAIGLMMRADLNPCGLHGAALMNGDSAFFNCRRNGFPGSSCVGKNGQPASIPGWLRLSRVGDRVTASTSTDGSAWTPLGSQSIALPRAVSVGFLITHGGIADVTFSNVSVTTP